MRFKLTLALLSCVVMFAYVSYGQQKQKQSLETIEEQNTVGLNSQEINRELPTRVNPEQSLKTPIPINPSGYEKNQSSYQENLDFGYKEPNLPEPSDNDYSQTPVEPYENVQVTQGTYMTLTPTPTNKSNTVGNPLYELRLYANGRLMATYKTVTGRAESQNRNRHQSGTEAPLPDGQYQVASAVVAGTHPEVGGRFLPIEPLFATGRYALGIHYDPSFQKTNGEDGTQGCIALTNKRDLDQVLQYVHTYQPQYLEVKLQV
ncbi:MAG: L,D-transpeptidase [Crocosphaera sp.]